MHVLIRGLFCVLVAMPSLAQQIAVQPKVSTLGAGADLVLGLSPNLNARLGAQLFSHTRDLEQSDIKYEGTAELRSGNVLLDLYPAAAGAFRISGGALLSDNSFTGRSNEDTIIEVNGVGYPVALVGVITAEVTANKVAPYLGIGFGNPLSPGARRWRFAVDIGAVYQGEPEVKLTATPFLPIPLPASFERDLAAEEQDLQEELRQYKIYPVLSIGIGYRF